MFLLLLFPPIEAPGRMDQQWILLPYLLFPPFRGLVPTSRPVEEKKSQCAYQLLIDLKISYLDRIRANFPLPLSYCLFLLLAHCRWALTRLVLIAIYWCSRHRKSRRLIQHLAKYPFQFRPPASLCSSSWSSRFISLKPLTGIGRYPPSQQHTFQNQSDPY